MPNTNQAVPVSIFIPYKSHARKKQRKLKRQRTPEQTAEQRQTEKKGLTFLDLPDNARLLIYKYAGVHHACTTWVQPETHWKGHVRNFIQEGRRLSLQDSMREEDRFKVCKQRHLPINLLQVSKGVRNDVAPLLIGENNFATVLASWSDVHEFRQSFSRSFHYLKHLHIDLRAHDQRNLRTEIDGNGGVHKTIWHMWPDFCRDVREQMPRLRAFSLKCKVRDPEVARRLLEPMWDFPILQKCAILFNQQSIETIEPQVKRVCDHLTRRADPTPFPFNMLPGEIKLQILEHALTNRSDPFAYNTGNSPSVGLASVRGVVHLQRRRHMCVLPENPLVCCGTCSPMKTQCFCASRQTAYSSSCSCFSSPANCFLVSRDFYSIAAEVFFSLNTFLLIDDDPFSFLRITNGIPNEHLRYIHTLVLQFPRLTRVPTRPAHRPNLTALQSWSILRRFVRDHFNLHRLGLYILDLGTSVDDPDTPLTRVQFVRALLREFVDLRGLRDFWVFLADDREFEREARRLVLGDQRGAVRPPQFVRDFASLGDIRR